MAVVTTVERVGGDCGGDCGRRRGGCGACPFSEGHTPAPPPTAAQRREARCLRPCACRRLRLLSLLLLLSPSPASVCCRARARARARAGASASARRDLPPRGCRIPRAIVAGAGPLLGAARRCHALAGRRQALPRPLCTAQQRTAIRCPLAAAVEPAAVQPDAVQIARPRSQRQGLPRRRRHWPLAAAPHARRWNNAERLDRHAHSHLPRASIPPATHPLPFPSGCFCRPCFCFCFCCCCCCFCFCCRRR